MRRLIHGIMNYKLHADEGEMAERLTEMFVYSYVARDIRSDTVSMNGSGQLYPSLGQ